MNKILFVLILLSSSVAYAQDPFVKTFYKGKNWTVMEFGITGSFKLCSLESSPFYADPESEPVNNFWTLTGKNYCSSFLSPNVSAGGLIHAASGKAGGNGTPLTNLSG